MTPEQLVATSDRITTEQVDRWIADGHLVLDADGHIRNPDDIKYLIAADLLDPPTGDTP